MKLVMAIGSSCAACAGAMSHSLARSQKRFPRPSTRVFRCLAVWGMASTCCAKSRRVNNLVAARLEGPGSLNRRAETLGHHPDYCVATCTHETFTVLGEDQDVGLDVPFPRRFARRTAGHRSAGPQKLAENKITTTLAFSELAARMRARVPGRENDMSAATACVLIFLFHFGAVRVSKARATFLKNGRCSSL